MLANLYELCCDSSSSSALSQIGISLNKIMYLVRQHVPSSTKFIFSCKN